MIKEKNKTSIEADINRIKSTVSIHLGRWRTDVDNDCPDKNDHEACEELIIVTIAAVKIHNNFDNSSVIIGSEKFYPNKNDIAIIKLGWPIKYKHNTKPVCLPTIKHTSSFTAVEVSGFGKNSFIFIKFLILNFSKRIS